ncbi:DNA-binding MarR family transcriptional regulator [Paraburkholderia sp. JPY158]|uniref:DNA-binding MarR family transcriptional regulator n=1 Tax=Paraburkholderia atlantica TaxID=2654982 RepID=A0A7W8Q5D8_PARAM|nr:MarR family transcriptional regulator [Paraburkholderia atlantica]MBB5423584.1 DNA-binding MarR family transcriptional regulator [Paraburkholderia atlantica]
MAELTRVTGNGTCRALAWTTVSRSMPIACLLGNAYLRSDKRGSEPIDNRMGARKTADSLFAALADASRRQLLTLLNAGPQSAAALAGELKISRASVIGHLNALAEAGWVDVGSDDDGEVLYSKRSQAEAQFQAECEALQKPASAEVSDALDEQAAAWAREWPAEDPNVYLIGQRLLRLSAHIDRALKEAAASQGLLAAELLLLDALLVSGPPYTQSPTQLQKPLAMTLGGITKCVGRLEQMGLVERMPDPADGRGILVRMKSQARKVLRNILHQQAYGTDWVASSHMAAERRAALSTLLRELQLFADAEAAHRSAERG